MALRGDYTATSQACHDTSTPSRRGRAAKQGTARADCLKLDEMGMPGITHMMMLDTRNLEVADVMLDWVKKHVPSARRR